MSGPLDVALLSVTPSAVVAMDTEGRITMLNPAAERLLSTTDDEAVGRLYTEVFGASLSDRLTALFIRAARRSGAPQRVEATLPGGRRATLRASAGPLRDAGGAVVGIVFAAEDQTDVVAEREEAKEEAGRERKIREAMRRYVGDAVAATVEARPSLVQVGGTRQVVSVLHADVRGYTTVAESLPPEEVHTLLLRYHGAAVAAIRGAGGSPDRYVGDAILALWNAPQPQEDHARRALRGALALVAATRGLGDRMVYGVGVHTGEAVVGNLGSAEYLHYTAIGDTVNVAARLQGAAEGGSVICSVAALSAAGAGVRATPLGPLVVKGRRNPVEAYHLESVEEDA